MALEIVGRGSSKRASAAVVSLEGAKAADLRASIALAQAYHPEPFFVAVDGGLATFKAIRRTPHLFVGDLDSTPRAPRGFPSTIYPVDKDFSDFAGALAELARRRTGVVVVAGLLGGRLDHELANLLEVGEAARAGATILAPSRRGLVAVTAGRLRADTVEGRTVSLFALGGPARVTLAGTRWKLDRKRVPPGSLGLSNRTGTRLDLTVHEGVAALVLPGRPQRRP